MTRTCASPIETRCIVSALTFQAYDIVANLPDEVSQSFRDLTWLRDKIDKMLSRLIISGGNYPWCATYQFLFVQRDHHL